MCLFLFFFFFVNVRESCKLGHACEQVTNSTVEKESKAKKKRSEAKKITFEIKRHARLVLIFQFFFPSLESRLFSFY